MKLRSDIDKCQTRKNKKKLLIKILLIVAAIYLSLIATEAAIQVYGGYITQIDFEGTSNTEHWLGFHGEITDYTITIENSRIRNNDSIQKFFLHISVHEGDYIFITTSSSPPVISELHAGNIASVDEITGGGYDSGSNTFTYSSTYRIPYTGIILDKVPVIYVFDGRQRTNYIMEGLLEDANGNLVLAVPLNGFQGEKNNFSFMLPDNDNNNLTYSIFYLPSQEDIHLE
jgi:hypothetical protein